MEDLRAALDRCARICGTTVEAIVKQKQRSTREVAEAKQLFVYCALRDDEDLKKKDVAAALNVGQYQVSYYLRKAMFSIRREKWFKDLVKQYYGEI